METLIKIIILIVMCFGIFYLIGAFLANSWDPMQWSTFGKIMYLIFSFSALKGAIEVLE